jgi:hypothetical protein
MTNYKKISKKREIEIGKQIGGRPHPGSGCFWHKKGDASNEYLLIEDKFVISNKYSIQMSIIKKLTKEANQQDKLPILRFGFHKEGSKKDYACVESCYCNDMISFAGHETNKKSLTLTNEYLYECYTTCENEIMCLTVSFLIEDRKFYVFEWNEFLDNIDKILP